MIDDSVGMKVRISKSSKAMFTLKFSWDILNLLLDAKINSFLAALARGTVRLGKKINPT